MLKRYILTLLLVSATSISILAQPKVVAHRGCRDIDGQYENTVQSREARPLLFTKINVDDKVDSITIYNNLDPVNCKKSYDLCPGCATSLMEWVEMEYFDPNVDSLDKEEYLLRNRSIKEDD